MDTFKVCTIVLIPKNPLNIQVSFAWCVRENKTLTIPLIHSFQVNSVFSFPNFKFTSLPTDQVYLQEFSHLIYFGHPVPMATWGFMADPKIYWPLVQQLVKTLREYGGPMFDRKLIFEVSISHAGQKVLPSSLDRLLVARCSIERLPCLSAISVTISQCLPPKPENSFSSQCRRYD